MNRPNMLVFIASAILVISLLFLEAMPDVQYAFLAVSIGIFLYAGYLFINSKNKRKR